MKKVLLFQMIIAAAIAFTACDGSYPEVTNKNQYVHLFLIQNNTPYDLLILKEAKDGYIGNGTAQTSSQTGDRLLYAEAIVNYQEQITENTLLSLKQELHSDLKSIEFQILQYDENGNLTYSKKYPFTSDITTSPYWSENYKLTDTESVRSNYIDEYKSKVNDGHVKVYVLYVTDEYLESLL